MHPKEPSVIHYVVRCADCPGQDFNVGQVLRRNQCRLRNDHRDSGQLQIGKLSRSFLLSNVVDRCETLSIIISHSATSTTDCGPADVLWPNSPPFGTQCE